MKSVIALTLAVFCLSMLIDFGDCRHQDELHKDIRGIRKYSDLPSSFELLASGVMDALEILARGAVTANTVAKFIIDTLNVLMNVGLF
ncbi:hypothetical protein QLX08_010447 [Tetragonisca angustula]|uniref:Uncharacterized protein n=1 Tax=Tetragonisca angustula TaxID=166442 RepID=A0AAW0ZCK6_9HYME